MSLERLEIDEKSSFPVDYLEWVFICGPVREDYSQLSITGHIGREAAEQIVMRCNVHDELLDALKDLSNSAEVFSADQSRTTDPRVGITQPVDVEECNALNSSLCKARSAIAKAEGIE